MAVLVAADLMELAGRCEGAPAADGMLDQAIGNLFWQDQTEQSRRNVFDCYQDYTSSLDAALALVPEGWRVVGFAERDKGGWSASLFPRDPEALGIPRTYEAHAATVSRGMAATAALALTAACLRARAAISKKDD